MKGGIGGHRYKKCFLHIFIPMLLMCESSVKIGLVVFEIMSGQELGGIIIIITRATLIAGNHRSRPFSVKESFIIGLPVCQDINIH